jgi:hypothetical protein
MKTPQPDLYTERVLLFAWRFISLPFVVTAAACRWVRGRLRSGTSAGDLRDADQLRQSRARRELRGLPPDHQRGRRP